PERNVGAVEPHRPARPVRPRKKPAARYGDDPALMAAGLEAEPSVDHTEAGTQDEHRRRGVERRILRAAHAHGKTGRRCARRGSLRSPAAPRRPRPWALWKPPLPAPGAGAPVPP